MINLISLTDAGRLLAERLQKLISSEVQLWHKPQPFTDTVQQLFAKGETLIFICATGIVIRSLAAVLQSKQSDPAVLVLDEQGQFVIPLLSGHQGGANQLAAEIAELLAAQLVSTTANAYLQPVYTAGMGCERGCSAASLHALLEQSVASAGLDIRQICAIASIDIKHDEVGLIALAKDLNIPFYCYEVALLKTVEQQLQTPSEYVYKTVGVYGVAESAALISAERCVAQGADQSVEKITELLLAKQKSKVATCAIGRGYRV